MTVLIHSASLITAPIPFFRVVRFEKKLHVLTLLRLHPFNLHTHRLRPLPLKYVQVRQGLERADAVRICPDDLLVVEEDPRVTAITLRADVGDIVARVDGWAFVRNEGPKAVTRRQRGRSGERWGCRSPSSFVFLACVIRMREQPFDGTLWISVLQIELFPSRC
jgi:hypothetical protein